MRRLLVIVLLAGFGCGKKTVPATTVPATVINPHADLYQLGLTAFREFTPEGYRRAIGYFHRASDLAPGICDYRLHLAQASVFLAFEQSTNLEDYANTLNQSDPPACGDGSAFSLHLETFRAHRSFGLGRDRAAGLSQVNALLAREPENALNWFLAWEFGSNSNQNASPIFQEPDLPSDLAIIRYYRGRYWLLRGDPVRARRSFERALELSPRHFRSYLGLAEAASTIDADADVEHYYKTVVEIAPEFLLGRSSLGDYYSWIAETGLAEEQYRSALKQNPRYIPAYLGLGQAMLSAGMLEQAEQALTSAIRIAPGAYEAYYYLGNVWLAREEFHKAREQYEAALNQVPVYPEALYALGVVFGETHQFDAALEQFEKVLRVSPRHPGAFFWRAVIRADRKQFAEALSDCARSIALYDEQIAVVTRSIANAERRGLTRRVASEQRKKDQLEETRHRVMELKASL